jgi:hypothetical protein
MCDRVPSHRSVCGEGRVQARSEIAELLRWQTEESRRIAADRTQKPSATEEGRACPQTFLAEKLAPSQ